MTRQAQVALVDTNIIIESVRTKIWAAVTGQFSVETVERCVDETQFNSGRGGYIPISDTDLARLGAVHPVNPTEEAALLLAYADADGLDDGERLLIAHAHSRPDDGWSIVLADGAAVKAVVALDLHHLLISLEALAAQAGRKKVAALSDWFRDKWLRQKVSEGILGA